MKASTLKGYREKIRKATRSVGTYKPEFEVVIARLAGYYLRDKELDQIYSDGVRRINEAALAARQAEDPLAAALSGLRGGGGP